LKKVKKHISVLVLCLVSLFVKGDNEYQQRLSSLHYSIPLPYNDYIKNYIDYYLSSPLQTKKILGLWKHFEATIEKQVKISQMPDELKFLPIALSSMNPSSINGAGASGPWMIMFNDGKMQKLKQTSLIDERRDWEKSTKAACNYFKDLLNIYNNDWMLAMAAYANTPAAVNKAIITSGTSMNYWSIYPTLPAETRDIVPKFVAAVYIANFYKLHDLSPEILDLPLETDSIAVDRKLTFDQISSVINVPVYTLELLNPIYKKKEIPFAETKYTLRLPKGKGQLFEDKKYDIYSFVPVKPVDDKPNIKRDTATATKPAQPAIFRVAYTVKRGETLVQICDYFDCTLYLARYWNRLKNNYVGPGKKLYFWVNAEKKSYYESINTLAAAQKKKLSVKD